jgi:hypothetical protein
MGAQCTRDRVRLPRSCFFCLGIFNSEMVASNKAGPSHADTTTRDRCAAVAKSLSGCLHRAAVVFTFSRPFHEPCALDLLVPSWLVLLYCCYVLPVPPTERQKQQKTFHKENTEAEVSIFTRCKTRSLDFHCRYKSYGNDFAMGQTSGFFTRCKSWLLQSYGNKLVYGPWAKWAGRTFWL